MKRIFLTFVFVLSVLQLVKSGPWYLYTSTYVYNGLVSAEVLNSNSDLSAPQKEAARNALLDPYNSDFGFLGLQVADILSEATYSYNCHAYAWHLTEGYSNKVWINNTDGSINMNGCYISNNNIDSYWSSNNGYFIECIESQAEKIHYYCGDHSAIKSNVSGKYESKWGDYPVVRHSPTQVPTGYLSSYRRYYKKISPPTITGTSNLICSSSNTTFNFSNKPSQAQWAYSSNINAPTESGNQVSFSGKSGLDYLGWIGLQINEHVYFKKDVWVGKPWISYISGTDAPTLGTTEYYRVYAMEEGLSEPNWSTWSISPYYPWSMWDWPASLSCEFTFFYLGHHRVDVSIQNRCGSNVNSGYYTSLWVGNRSPVAAYPNPVSDILNIEIKQQANSQSQSITDEKPFKSAFTYDIRLYDGQGNLLRHVTTKGGTVEFNVNNLPNGIYYLHVYDGVNSTPEVQQILVER